MNDVIIHYRRLPGDVTIFRQRLVHRDHGCIITLMERTPLRAPVIASGRTILEPDAPVVWFTFPGAWHDIGRFHTATGEFTGWYANILTPVRSRSPTEWETTDLCLDVWRGADDVVEVLDRDEFVDAVAAGWMTAGTAAQAEAEADRLERAARAALWPPARVLDWTLDRARAASRDGTPTDGPV